MSLYRKSKSTLFWDLTVCNPYLSDLHSCLQPFYTQQDYLLKYKLFTRVWVAGPDMNCGGCYINGQSPG